MNQEMFTNLYMYHFSVKFSNKARKFNFQVFGKKPWLSG